MPIFFREPGWNPQGELEQLQRRMDRLFQNTYGREGRPGWVGVYPLVNISEDPGPHPGPGRTARGPGGRP